MRNFIASSPTSGWLKLIILVVFDLNTVMPYVADINQKMGRNSGKVQTAALVLNNRIITNLRSRSSTSLNPPMKPNNKVIFT